MNFDKMGLLPKILDAIKGAGYTAPTPIQDAAIPAALGGKDILGCAQTGTGKTAAFSIPILQQLQTTPLSREALNAPPSKRARALILTPTRELALQIEQNIKTYGKYLNQKCCLIIGGISQKPQETAIRQGKDILIATPGRLLDLVWQGVVDLSNIQILVLDEADRMLDMGFLPDVKRCLEFLPKQKQTLFFTATMPPPVLELSKTLLSKDFVHIAVTPVSSTVDKIEQFVYKTDGKSKTDLMLHLIQDKQIDHALVFCRTKHGADRLADKLGKSGIASAAIHGDKSQGARQGALSGFKNKRIKILVATDIAARGIDIDELGYVFNYDLPNEPETYVHRIGRTGRAGRTGVAISFCDYDELGYLKDITRLIKRNIETVESPYPMTVFVKKPPRQQPPPRPKNSNNNNNHKGNNNNRHNNKQSTTQQSK